jgi:hypothetical protein
VLLSAATLCVQADSRLAFDWDDVAGNSKRRLAGLALEKQRKEQMKVRRQEAKGKPGSIAGSKKKH